MELKRSNTALLTGLASQLPKDVSFKVYHLSTTPTRVSSVYLNIPGHKSDKTVCTKHFLVLATNIPLDENSLETRLVLFYAIEIFVFFTAHQITIFVSKADSTGYLNHTNNVKKTPSPIRIISTTFIHYIISTYKRPNIPMVISLFARAQDQYLFTGSIEYSGKHVLSDRGLIRWWCQVLNPIVENSKTEIDSNWKSVRGYVIVPGLDAHETLCYLPNRTNNLWTVGHPLLEISRVKSAVAPRYLIPRFPDDPKARFLDELDHEVNKSNHLNGEWKSITTMEQFWEMMAYRQECSAGKLVGFIWIVLTPYQDDTKRESTDVDEDATISNDHNEHEVKNHNLPQSLINCTLSDKSVTVSAATPETMEDSRGLVHASAIHDPGCRKKRILSGQILTRKPRLKNDNDRTRIRRSYSKRKSRARNEPHDPGHLVVDDGDYQRLMKFLLSLDFSEPERAISSSKRWIEETCCASQNSKIRESWGQTVTGTKLYETTALSTDITLNTLNPILVRKKRKNVSVDENDSTVRVN